MTKTKSQAVKRFENNIKKWLNTYLPQVDANRPDIERDIHRFAMYLEKNTPPIERKGE
ncbi:MAG: hypothetical protein IKS41_07225 [Alphaproteobacteria bacterium]|nr:hypothetical protein [Alphaproteobacteria bacterium]